MSGGLGDLYCTVNDKGTVIEANLTTAKLLGLRRDRLIKQPFTRFIEPADLDVFNLMQETADPDPSGMSHQFRTPTTGVLGMAQVRALFAPTASAKGLRTDFGWQGRLLRNSTLAHNGAA